MSEPQTDAGRALVEAFFGEQWDVPLDPGTAIAAIEAEAAAIERARLTTEIAALEARLPDSDSVDAVCQGMRAAYAAVRALGLAG